MTIIYRGFRDRHGAHVHRLVDHKRHVLRLRLDLDNHSPTGFNWGYLGSGPAQLALALLADVLNNDVRALKLHQEFKRRAIAPIQDDEWRLTPQQIIDHANAIEEEIATCSGKR
jgi:uncharacterized protein (DUF2249 family)